MSVFFLGGGKSWKGDEVAGMVVCMAAPVGPGEEKCVCIYGRLSYSVVPGINFFSHVWLCWRDGRVVVGGGRRRQGGWGGCARECQYVNSAEGYTDPHFFPI